MIIKSPLLTTPLYRLNPLGRRKSTDGKKTMKQVIISVLNNEKDDAQKQQAESHWQEGLIWKIK